MNPDELELEESPVSELEDDSAVVPREADTGDAWVCQCVCDNPGVVH